jgi:hypothetical protein
MNLIVNNFVLLWVRQLTDQTAFLTIGDCNSEARGIHIVMMPIIMRRRGNQQLGSRMGTIA